MDLNLQTFNGNAGLSANTLPVWEFSHQLWTSGNSATPIAQHNGVCLAQRAKRLLRAAFQTFNIKWRHEVRQSERKKHCEMQRGSDWWRAPPIISDFIYFFGVPMSPGPAAPQLMASHILGRGQWMLIRSTAASLNGSRGRREQVY